MKRNLSQESPGVNRKRQKTRDARFIPSETSSSSVKSGNLPIQDFLASRNFEINALTQSIKKSRESGVQRAFQSLPRYLRRRAASHNVKRVPKRLRARALGELEADKKTSTGTRVPFRKKRAKRNTLKLHAKAVCPEPINGGPFVAGTDLPAFKPLETGRYVERQRNKTWLPTHLWSCKRAKMLVKWGYSVALTPNEKTYRATHRATSKKGCIAFDTSYSGTILLRGTSEQVGSVLEKLTEAKEAGGARLQRGSHSWSGHVFSLVGQVICPVTILYAPPRGNCNEVPLPETNVILRVHPAVFGQVWKLLLHIRGSVKIVDLRFELGSIDIIGPLATDALLSVLKAQGEFSDLWKSLHGMTSSLLPHSVVLPLKVRDPRSSFPPKIDLSMQPKPQNNYLLQWPTGPPLSDLFFPALLTKQNLHKPKGASYSSNDAPLFSIIALRGVTGWSVLIPWAYVKEVWYSLMHISHVRFGGLRELAQIAYGNRLLHFPNDYPGTDAGDIAEQELTKEREAAYRRRPPAKRVSFVKLQLHPGEGEIGNPFSCDFQRLVNTSPDASLTHASHVSVTSSSVITGDRTTLLDYSMEDVQPIFTSTPSVAGLLPLPTNDFSVPGPTSKASDVRNISYESKQPISAVRILLGKHAQALLSGKSAHSGWELSRGITPVRFDMEQRGCPVSRARVYDSDKAGGRVIGFVTTGNFDLGAGKGTAIGSILFSHVEQTFVCLDKKMKGTGKAIFGTCYIRDVGTANFRRALWELLD